MSLRVTLRYRDARLQVLSLGFGFGGEVLQPKQMRNLAQRRSSLFAAHCKNRSRRIGRRGHKLDGLVNLLRHAD